MCSIARFRNFLAPLSAENGGCAILEAWRTAGSSALAREADAIVAQASDSQNPLDSQVQQVVVLQTSFRFRCPSIQFRPSTKRFVVVRLLIRKPMLPRLDRIHDYARSL